MAGRKNDSLRKPDEQYSLFKFIFRFAVKTGNRNQKTKYSWDFDSERQKFLPGIDAESRRVWRNLLSCDPVANEPELYNCLSKFRPHYNANENQLIIWFPPALSKHFEAVWDTFDSNLTESIELLNLNALTPGLLNEEKHTRQIRLLSYSIGDERFQAFNAYQKLAVYYSEGIQKGEIVGIDIYDNLNYTPDNYLGMMNIDNLPGLIKDVNEMPEHDLKSRNSDVQPAGKLIENAFGRAV